MSAKMNMSVMRKILTGRGVLLALIAVVVAGEVCAAELVVDRSGASIAGATAEYTGMTLHGDYTLSVPGEGQRYVKKNLRPGIWWEGRRYGDNCGKAGSYAYQFFTQGLLATRLVVDGAVQESPSAWRQRLDVRHLSSAFADASVRRGRSKECGENKTKRKDATK